MISALASESLTSSGRSRSNRSVGRLSKSLTNACNSVNVFASIAFITIDDVGTLSFLASAMSIISPAYFSVGPQFRQQHPRRRAPYHHRRKDGSAGGDEGVSIGGREHQHRQEYLCHIDPAVLAGCWFREELVWHRHSCLCWCKMQWLLLLTRDDT